MGALSSLLIPTSRRAKLPLWCLRRPQRNARCVEDALRLARVCSCRLLSGWGKLMAVVSNRLLTGCMMPFSSHRKTP